MKGKIDRLLPNRAEFRQACWPVIRATGLGSLIGMLPGGGPVIASFGSYALEKKIAKDPSRFGKGAIEGLAGPEAANNAAVQTSFIPLLTLGLPSNPTMALMAAGMTIHGIIPGPQVMTDPPGTLLGNDRQHVDREPHVTRAQPAANWTLGSALEDPVPALVPLHSAGLRAWGF